MFDLSSQKNIFADIICKNTGMSFEDLVCDTKEYKIKGLDKVADILKTAAKSRRPIHIIGDYDVDGITASSILALGLKELNAHIFVRLPKRFSEGYGLNESMIDEIKPGSLIITVDNGIKASAAIKKAKEKNIFVILTDHHLPDTDEFGNIVYPEADIIIDPNAVPDQADFNGYCGAGIAYKIVMELLGKNHPIIPKLTSLAAIGTIADSVPLTFENRRIVKEGLKSMLHESGRTKGLYALLSVFENTEYIDEDSIAYEIAPALNAPARLYDNGAIVSFKLLTYEGETRKAFYLANKQLEYNNKRKNITNDWIPKIVDHIKDNKFDKDMIIVDYMEDIPEGIIGILAGRISDEFKKPCIIFTNVKNGILKGSGRSYGDFNIKESIDRVKDFTVQYGGHAGAAGVSIKEDDLLSFRSEINNCSSGIKISDIIDDQTVVDIDVYHINDVFDEYLMFRPYGEGNPAPKVRIKNLDLIPKGSDCYRWLNDSHKAVLLYSQYINAITFTNGEEYEKIGLPKCITLTGSFSVNYFNKKIDKRIIFDTIEAAKKAPMKTSFAKRLERRAKSRYGNESAFSL